MHRSTIWHKDFVLMAIGQIVSLFGNQILRYALPLYLLEQTGSAALFGSVMAVSFVPMLVMFPVGGIVADRVNKRNIMVALDLCTALLIAMFYGLSGAVAVVPRMAVTLLLLFGIQGAYQPAVKASVPVLVATEHMMKANSVVDLISSLAGVVGPVAGGILFSVLGLTPILSVSIGCFLASAIMELFIHIPFEKKQGGGNPLAVGLGDLRESVEFMAKVQPTLWKMPLVFASVNLLLTSLVLIGMPVLITQYLGFVPDAANRLYGYAQGAVAAGAVLGGLLAGTLSNWLRPRTMPLVLLGCALSTATGGVALQALGEAMAIYLVLVAGASLLVALSTLFAIQMMTHLQILTPPALTGKVISCVMCVSMGTNPLGQILYGVVFEHIGRRAYLPFYAAALLVAGIVALTRHVFLDIDSPMGERTGPHQRTGNDDEAQAGLHAR